MPRSSPAMDAAPVTDAEIRACLKAHLAGRAEHLIDEFRVDGGAARIDVTLLGHRRLVGYEIKSDLDTFARLSNQIHAYNRVFDTIFIACGSKHTETALSLLPSWWGVLEAARSTSGSVALRERRPASSNPRQEAFSLASLLGKDEAIAVLISHNQQAPSKASLRLLWAQLADSIAADRLREIVLDTLSKRPAYNAAAVNTM